MSMAEIDRQISNISGLLMSDDVDSAIEGARQLRMLSIQNRDNEDIRYRLGSCYELRRGILSMLNSNSDAARYWSCHCIVALSHKHKRNQSTMAKHPGLMHAFVKVLSCGTTPSKGAACSALVESTFRNAENALLVAKTPGLLQGVVAVMQANQGDVRDDAAGVLRNCSNYSYEAAEVIVRTPGVLCALIDMCKGEFNSDRFTAMGTIQNLTRCCAVVPLLRQTRVIPDALLPAMSAEGEGEDVEVMRAESLMALTNLTPDSDIERLCPEPCILSVLTQMLLCAIRGQAWRDVAWYDSDECLRPLARLADNACNRATLVQLGLVAILAEFLASALVAAMSSKAGLDAGPTDDDGTGGAADTHPRSEESVGSVDGVEVSRSFHGDEAVGSVHSGRSGAGLGANLDMCAWVEQRHDCCSMSERCTREMGLAVEALAVLARHREGLERMHKAQLAPLLRLVAAATRRSAAAGLDLEGGASRTGWVLRERHLAVAMGQHSRLGGAGCWLMCLDAPVLWMILDAAADTSVVSDALAQLIDAEQSEDLPACAATDSSKAVSHVRGAEPGAGFGCGACDLAAARERDVTSEGDAAWGPNQEG